MSEKSEALRLAGALTAATEQTDAEDDVIHVARWFVEDAAAELRRLSIENERTGPLAERVLEIKAQRDALLKALNAMLTHMGMDEDEWNKPTFDQARAAIKAVEGDKEAHWQAVAQEAQKHFDEGLKKFEGEKE